MSTAHKPELRGRPASAPCVEITFANEVDSARAWRLAAWGRPTVGTARGGMIADSEQLAILRDARIAIFSPPSDGEAPETVPLDIDAVIADLHALRQALENGA